MTSIEAGCGAERATTIRSGECPECRSRDLAWSFTPVKTTEAQDGRLRLNEVCGQFYLGCEECSETLLLADAEEVVAFLNAGSTITLAQAVMAS
jgi:hypothetical protein